MTTISSPVQAPCPFPAHIRRVGLFSLSGAPDVARLQRAEARLRAWGIETISVPFHSAPERYLAASDEERVRAFETLIRDYSGSVQLFMATKGGFGATRILDRLDWDLIRNCPVPFCGYSDVSGFLLAAYAHGCRNLYHGPMFCSTFGTDDSTGFPENLESFRRCLQGEALPFWAGAPQPVCLKSGTASGLLIPVNLTLLSCLLGTPHLPDLTGTILLLEDISEPAHAIDRLLAHLQSAGLLEKLNGLLFGQFANGEDAEYLPEILRDWAQKISGPVLCGLPFGHIFPTLSARVGAKVQIKTDFPFIENL